MGIQIDPIRETDHIINWLKDKFADYGEETKAVIGMSGGKDSTIAAALLCQAIGPERVVGVIMPNGEMKDQKLAENICEHLDMQYYVINIADAVNGLYHSLYNRDIDYSNPIIATNTPARIRMTTLYAVAATCHGRVVNTCNESEEYIGWSTKYGDNAGDFSVLRSYPVRWVKQIGYELVSRNVLKLEWIDKIPDDGMCGMSDEEKFGFTYEELDEYILNRECSSAIAAARIKKMNKASRHKDNIRMSEPTPISQYNDDPTKERELVWF